MPWIMQFCRLSFCRMSWRKFEWFGFRGGPTDNFTKLFLSWKNKLHPFSAKFNIWYKVAAFTIGLYHPLDRVTNPKYKLLHFLTTIFFYKEKKALAFNWDRCCHLAFCLQLILFHWITNCNSTQWGLVASSSSRRGDKRSSLFQAEEEKVL